MTGLIGATLDAYQIVSLIGSGGMAKVYKAFQPGVERYVALKVLPPALAHNEQFVQRFNREARLLARLQHPHILPVFDFGQAQGVTYLVMPLIESGTLADRLQGQPLSPAHIQRVAHQVGDALDYAHSRGLVHRDVKPSNILLDGQGNCLLADFGIARMLADDSGLTGAGGVVGAPTYMSPEQGRGETLDGCSDIYSLGVILYQMATGRVPFQGDGLLSVLVQHLTAPVPPPRSVNPDLSPRMEQVLLRVLEKEPQRRFQNAAALLQDLEAA